MENVRLYKLGRVFFLKHFYPDLHVTGRSKHFDNRLTKTGDGGLVGVPSSKLQ